VDCISKNLACGDIGKGAMENVPKIVKKCKYIAEEYLLIDFEAKLEELHAKEDEERDRQVNEIQEMMVENQGSFKKQDKASVGIGTDDGPFD